jgi:hypothetical protein
MGNQNWGRGLIAVMFRTWGVVYCQSHIGHTSMEKAESTQGEEELVSHESGMPDHAATDLTVKRT